MSRPDPLTGGKLGHELLGQLRTTRDAIAAWMDAQPDPTAEAVMRAGATFHSLAALVGYPTDEPTRSLGLTPQRFVEQMVDAGCPLAFVINPAGQAAIAMADGVQKADVVGLFRQAADDLAVGKVQLAVRDDS